MNMGGRTTMTELLVAFIAGGALSGIISGIFSMIMYKTKRKDQQADEQTDETDVIKKALRYIMLYIIQDRAEEYIRRGTITMEERRSLHKWHDLYHNGLDGNGDADFLMSQIDEIGVDL